MELVYLWVEKYKNIKNQGFNFSPRFTCKYENGKLTIEEKKDYVSIFPDNIDIAAIVGENGSGKSTIGEILGIFTYTEDLSNNSFLVFFDGNKFLFKKSYTEDAIFFNVINNTNFDYENKYIPRQIFAKYFANELSTFLNNNKPYTESLKINDGFNGYYEYIKPLMKNNSPHINEGEKTKYDLFNKIFLKLLTENKNTFDFINENYMFDRYQSELHLYEFGTFFLSNENFLKLIGGKLQTYTIFVENDTHPEITLFKFLVLYKLFHQIDIPTFYQNIFEDIKADFDSLSSIDDYANIINLLDTNENIFTRQNVENILEKFEYKGKEIWREKKSNDIKNIAGNSNPLLQKLTENFNRPYIYNSKDEDYNFLSLSSGEREYLYLFTYFIHNLKKSDGREFVYIFDEPDLGLHPNLQKKLVKDMINAVEKYYYKNITNSIQLILTSHSPFILSDLPKGNVIFLKKDKEGNCKNVTEETKIETFGANIHTLLSHGFFMEGGLMGEFAKEKINDVIAFLNGNPSLIKNNDEAQKYINIIGEPVLQSTLQNMLDSKETKLDQLKRQQKEIEEAIKCEEQRDKSNEKS